MGDFPEIAHITFADMSVTLTVWGAGSIFLAGCQGTETKSQPSYFEGRGGEWTGGGPVSLCPGRRISGLQVRFSKVCSLTQGHRASLWQSYDLRPGLPDAKGDAPRTNNQNRTNIIIHNIK